MDTGRCKKTALRASPPRPTYSGGAARTTFDDTRTWNTLFGLLRNPLHPETLLPIAETPSTAIRAGSEPSRTSSGLCDLFHGGRAEPHIESATPTSLPTVKSLPVRAFDIAEGSQRISWAARLSDVDYMVIARPACRDTGCNDNINLRRSRLSRTPSACLGPNWLLQ